jgi:hypothetical protein
MSRWRSSCSRSSSFVESGFSRIAVTSPDCRIFRLQGKGDRRTSLAFDLDDLERRYDDLSRRGAELRRHL